MHILLIEDHPKLAANIKAYLDSERYIVTVANDGSEGYELAMTREVDVIILDVNLPGMDGFTICAKLRENGKSMPILMLTARTNQPEITHGLNIGADDYLKKPFDLQELLARIRALLRRTGGERQTIVTHGDLVLDPNAHSVEKAGKRVNLSPKEFALLEFLLHRRGIVQDRPTIIEHVWGGGDSLLFSQTVDVHIANLRRKLGKETIQTVPSKGYMIERGSR